MAPKSLLLPQGGDPIDLVDSWPRELRLCVYDFGFSVVYAFVAAGVTNPRAIRQLINVVYLGAREPGNVRAGQPGPIRLLEEALTMHGAPGSSRAVLAHLRANFHTIVSYQPTADMLEASLHALDNAPLVPKAVKHRMRLEAAVRASDRKLGA